MRQLSQICNANFELSIVMGAICFCLGGSLQTAAQNLGFLYGGRAVAGLGVGIMVMIIPLYQAEIAHPLIRGRITGLQQFMLAIGALVACKPFRPLTLQPR
jgi:MFS family permease